MSTVQFDIEDEPVTEDEPGSADAWATEAEPVREPLSKADQKLCDDLAAIYRTVAITIGGIGVMRDDPGLNGTAGALMAKADKIAESWLVLASTNPAIKRALKRVTEGSAISGVVLLHIACIMPLLADRGIVPDQYAAIVSVM